MITNYLYKNLRWQFNQNPFVYLLCRATTERQFCRQVDQLANRYFPERRKVETLVTEFCLNKIALTKPKTEEAKVALQYYRNYADSYARLKRLFDRDYMELPSSGKETRVEATAELIAKCTQFAVDENTVSRLVNYVCDVLQLDEREERYLPYVLELFKIKFFCAATLQILNGDSSARKALAKAIEPTLLKFDYTDNDLYRQNVNAGEDIVSVVDCLGNSLASFRNINTQIDQKLFIYANGRNVFDTFCQSKFGENTSCFRSVSSANVTMRYFIKGASEIRQITVTNLCASRKFTVDVTFNHTNHNSKINYFKMGNALCLGISGDESFYCSTAVVADNKAAECAVNKGLSYEFSLKKGETAKFDIVTSYALSSPELADAVENLDVFGYTRCPYICDKSSSSVRESKIALSLIPNGCGKRNTSRELSSVIAYSYQLGDSDVATFIDNGGSSTTLLDGFVFGVKGESVYSVKYGLTAKLNEQNFRLDGDVLRYDKPNGSLAIKHLANAKVYDVAYSTPSKTLFYFPFEEKSRVTFNDNTFEVTDSKRKYYVKCYGEVESYAANALECNEEKLRYKLSNNLEGGSCLAVCFASARSVRLEISSANATPLSRPIIRESLVSTYLNYVNDKSVFCAKNHLKRPDALTIAGICYTNPQFVKEYVLAHWRRSDEYFYDVGGSRKTFEDRLCVPLACAYYLNLADDDLPDEVKKSVSGTVFNEKFTGKDLCVKALFLKRVAGLNGFDKVKCLVEYNLLKKQIVVDAKLYAYAQAIGAVPMYNPSKERLKDLCNKYSIPKNWYYVSQLENLYGLSICDGKLNVSPKVTSALEQIAINVKGKRIDTTFHKAAVQSMTLNGVQRFQPFRAQNLKNDDNTLEVRY